MSETRTYDFRISAGGLFPLDVQGNNFLIKSSSGAVNVKWQGGFLANLAAGQGQNVPEGFHRLDLTNSSSVTVYGELLISDENFIDKRITGDVSVIDGEKARSIASGRFQATADHTTPGQYPGVQLWNPAGSGKNLIVTSVDCGLSAAGSVRIYGDNVAFANDVSGSSISNALVGAAAGVAQVRREVFAAPPAIPFGRGREPIIPANSYIQVVLDGPMVVPPGFGVSTLGAPVGVVLGVSFQWFEEDEV